jgi:hypothetical protein
METRGTVYLIHFSRPIGNLDNPRGQARHYLGWALDLEVRMDAHAAGNGARLMEVITEAGINWRLARTWSGDRDDERRLKGQHNAPRLCPICNPDGWWRRGSDSPDRRH